MRFAQLALLALIAVPIGCATAGLAPNGVTPWGRAAEDDTHAAAISHYIASVALDQSGQQDKALAEVEQSVKLDPDAGTPTLQLVRGYLRQRNYEKALEMAKRAVELQPDKANLWVVQGEIYHQLKHYDEAVASFMKAIELNPENALGYGALVELRENTNDLVASVDIYKRLVELNPKSAGLYAQLGMNLARMNDNEGARSAFEKALELDGSLGRVRYLLGMLYFESNMNHEAETQLTAFLQQHPKDASTKEALAAVNSRLGNHDRASALYQDLLKGNDTKDDTAPQAGEAPKASGDAKRHLLAMLERIAAGHPADAEPLAPPTGAPILSTLLRAVARQEQHLPYRALLESLDTAEGNLDDECSTVLGDLMYAQGKQAFSDWLFARLDAYKAEGIHSRALDYIRARSLMQLKRFPDAIALLNGLVDGEPKIPTARYYLAIAHEDLHQFDKAAQELEVYARTKTDDPDILNFLAYLYTEEGVKLDEAEGLLKRALSAKPNNPFYLDSLGWLYYRRGKADQAIDCIQRAIYGMDSDDATLREHLGDAYLLKGDTVRAVEEWKRARRLDPKLEGVQAKIDAHKK